MEERGAVKWGYKSFVYDEVIEFFMHELRDIDADCTQMRFVGEEARKRYHPRAMVNSIYEKTVTAITLQVDMEIVIR